MSDRFDLEQEILACWAIVDDLKFMLDNSDNWSEDERLNYLIGLSVKYDKRFDHMFNTFEDVIKNAHFGDKVFQQSIHVQHHDDVPPMTANTFRDAYDHETYLDSLADR